MFSYMRRCETFWRQSRGSLWFTLLHGNKSILLNVSTSYNFTFWASEFTFCVCCVRVSLCACDVLSSAVLLFAFMYCTFSFWTLWRGALRSAAGLKEVVQPHLRVTAADLYVCLCVCVCERGLVSNLKRDLALVVVESRVVQGWNMSQRNPCHPGKRGGRGTQTCSD